MPPGAPRPRQVPARRRPRDGCRGPTARTPSPPATAAPSPALCKRLRALLGRARKPWQYDDGVLRAAMEIAPTILPKGRYRECHLAWREGAPLAVIATKVNVANPRTVRKRIEQASESVERALLGAFRGILNPRARRSLDAYRAKAVIPDAELDALAEDLAIALEALHLPGNRESGEAGRGA